MKHKLYRILTVFLAMLLIAGAVYAARLVYVFADGESTDAPTEATNPPTEPTEPPTEATNPPTEPPTDPTEPPTDPTEPPTEPPTGPSDPTNPPTEPPTDPGHTHSHAEGDAGTVIKEASCTEEGQVEYICAVCAEHYTESIPALGHAWGEWQEVTPATYESTGLRKHVCSRCGAEETESIPTIPYPEGSIVDVAFTVTGGKFSDGSTQKNVPVIKYENGVPSRNGVGHLKQEQIPTDMIPDEGYADGFWADPAPSPSLDITANTTFAYSYTGTFNYNGTYTSYNGPWRPTTPTQPRPTQPTQPRPTQPTTDNPTESEVPIAEDDILLVNGEAGDYGELIQVGDEQFWAYHLPQGSYLITNEGDDAASISIFSDDTLVNAEGKVVPAQQYANIVLQSGASSDFVVMLDSDRYVRLSDGAKVRFVLGEEPVESDSETETEATTSAIEESTSDPASESAEASETEPSDPGRQSMVLWPFIVVLALLLVGLGVLIFFIVRLLKKSGSDEGGDSADDEEEDE